MLFCGLAVHYSCLFYHKITAVPIPFRLVAYAPANEAETPGLRVFYCCRQGFPVMVLLPLFSRFLVLLHRLIQYDLQFL